MSCLEPVIVISLIIFAPAVVGQVKVVGGGGGWHSLRVL